MRGIRPRYGEPVAPPSLMAGTIHGVRTWGLEFDRGGTARLTGCTHRAHWRPGGETTWADCEETTREDGRHRAPSPAGNCSCGLYACHPGPSAVKHLRTMPRLGGHVVAGIVEAWGTVHVHREGFRAQYARPIALALCGCARGSQLGRLVDEIAAAHRAELVELAAPEELVGLCRERGLGLGGPTLTRLLGPVGAVGPA